MSIPYVPEILWSAQQAVAANQTPRRLWDPADLQSSAPRVNITLSIVHTGLKPDGGGTQASTDDVLICAVNAGTDMTDIEVADLTDALATTDQVITDANNRSNPFLFGPITARAEALFALVCATGEAANLLIRVIEEG